MQQSARSLGCYQNPALLIDVLEHVVDDVQVLDNAATLLKPGGVLVVSTKQSLEVDAQHLRHYSSEALRNLLNLVGLSVKAHLVLEGKYPVLAAAKEAVVDAALPPAATTPRLLQDEERAARLRRNVEVAHALVSANAARLQREHGRFIVLREDAPERILASGATAAEAWARVRVAGRPEQLLILEVPRPGENWRPVESPR